MVANHRLRNVTFCCAATARVGSVPKTPKKTNKPARRLPASKKPIVAVPAGPVAQDKRQVLGSPPITLQWRMLTSPSRLRGSAVQHSPYDHRSDFEGDFDRVTFSSSFRRLQDKTQVFPLESHDFIRTRLTHSCEVATKGRALGISAATQLIEDGKDRSVNPHDWGAIVATSCLLHDIGNPPFGHFGEKAIGQWFSDALHQGALKIDNPRQAKDLTRFEGNAYAFRVATRIQYQGSGFGLNLTAGTLAALIKYPCSSVETGTAGKSTAKFGYFAHDGVAYLRVRQAAGLTGHIRHPLTFLMEAADDIAYSSVDIEDGLKKRIIDVDQIEEALHSELATCGDPEVKKEIDDLVKSHLRERYERLAKDVPHLSKHDRQQYAYQHFRGMAVGLMAASAVQCFVAHYEEIMSGAFDSDLPARMRWAPLCLALKGLAAKLVYGHPDIVRIEVAGRRVLGHLLDTFVEEVKLRPNGKVAKLVPTIPCNPGDDTLEELSPDYEVGLRVAGYIAGMTDHYATTLYRRFVGIEL